MKKSKVKQQEKTVSKDLKSKEGKSRGRGPSIVELQWEDEERYARYLKYKV